ncbi:MAG: hypothetical protein LBI33_05405 [Propionibacteriaceae bacterium]|jgi:hypothetical protein|nr:hypothetical protein [Propionibacteriaceae bacterium]
MEPSRRSFTITVPTTPKTPAPRCRVRRVTAAPRGFGPVDALVAWPEGVTGGGGRTATKRAGVTLHFVGYNTPMGPWEAARLALWATQTGTIAVSCELPGLSRYGQPLPATVRQDARAGDPTAWAAATLACLRAALVAGDVPTPGPVSVLGYSTGCTLAAAALPAVMSETTVANLILVEPVSLVRRTLGALGLHNLADFARLPKALPANVAVPWILQASLREVGAPGVRYGLPDFLALTSLLSSADTTVRLESYLAADWALPPVHLARGAQSTLCSAPALANLDDLLGDAGVSGTTTQVTGLGHQWWHCLPAVAEFAQITT